jgi:hypothetical protein
MKHTSRIKFNFGNAISQKLFHAPFLRKTQDAVLHENKKEYQKIKQGRVQGEGVVLGLRKQRNQQQRK